MTTEQAEARTLPRVEDIIGGMNGFDEIAVEKAFGGDMGELNGSKTARATAFLLFRKDGMSDKDAYGEAMRKTLRELNEMFDTSDADEDEEPEGKG